jgi:hypothetical protein
MAIPAPVAFPTAFAALGSHAFPKALRGMGTLVYKALLRRRR